MKGKAAGCRLLATGGFRFGYDYGHKDETADVAVSCERNAKGQAAGLWLQEDFAENALCLHRAIYTYITSVANRFSYGNVAKPPNKLAASSL